MKVEGVDHEQRQGFDIPIELSVPWIDLSKMDSVSMKKRMRPMFYFGEFKPQNKKHYDKFSLNAHIDFFEGGTDRPTIGSTEDWYFINANSFSPHPIHIHLINYQIQKQYSLKVINGFVSYYLVDFYLKYANWNSECQVKNPNFDNFGVLQKKWRGG